MNNFLSVMNKYNEIDAQYLKGIIGMNALVGVPCDIATIEDFANWCEKTLAERDEADRKAVEKAERKAKNELAKATEKGMTLEEYQAYKKAKAKAKRYETEASGMREEVERLLKEIEWRERKAAEIRAEIGE